MKAKGIKIIAIVLAVVIVVAASLFLLKKWEDSQNSVPVINDEGVLTYEDIQYVKKDNIETFLVMGLDKYKDADSSESHESGVQADFLMLFVFDNQNEQCKALHINRDTITKVNKLAVGGTAVVDSFDVQIALAYNYVNDTNDKIRCRNVKDSVEHLLKGTTVNHYLSLNMDFVGAASDFVGGVEVKVEDDFTGIDDTIKKGETVLLKGKSALNFVRTRYGLEDNTNSTRMKRQQQFINSLYKTVFDKMGRDEKFAVDFVSAMDDYVAYDSSDHKMQKFAEKFNSYEFKGICELEGESKLGEEFIEFYPEEKNLMKTIIDLFYDIKK